MELSAARQIIDTLAQGIHPVTGYVMPEDSPYNAPPVIRALFAVSQALDGQVAPPPPRGTEVAEPFDIEATWESVEEAVVAIRAQPSQNAVLAAVVAYNIRIGEYGFASDLLSRF